MRDYIVCIACINFSEFLVISELLALTVGDSYQQATDNHKAIVILMDTE